MEKELPKGWIREKLLNISEVYTGKKDANYASINGKYNFFTCAYKPLRGDDFSYEGNVLIIPGNGANVGEVFYFSGKFEAYQRTYIVDNIKISPKFLFYQFKRFWREKGTSEQFGSATNYIKIGNFKNYFVQFPPLLEQKRIVTKLDKLFGNLDSIKAKLDNIPQLLKNFRQSVLTQAVTGRLTEEWRVGKDLGEWEEVLMSEVLFEKPRNGYSPKGVDYVTPVKSLILSATTSGNFDPSFVKYLDVPKPNPDSHLWLMNGDILVQRSNTLEYVGTSAIYTGEDYEFIYPDLMIKLKANDKVINYYLHYVLSSEETKNYFRAHATGTAGNMPKINQTVVMNTPVLLPNLSEQTEIVTRCESLFKKADKIEEHYITLKKQIENLPQAMLAKAFKGELVEQGLDDEPATVLLERIRKLKDKI